MGTTKATKAADKSQVCRKLVNSLHKLYGKSVPKIELPVVETMLFAACLEDNPWTTAEVGLKHLLASFFDLNEIRVSSVNELELVLGPLNRADWKGLRIRSILRHIFETTYSYDFEKLRRQTLEQAVKTLKKIPDVTPFIRDFVLHEILGSHIVFLDEYMQLSIDSNRLIVLADLIAFWQIRVKVVLSVEMRVMIDRASKCLSELDGVLHGAFIWYWECSRHTEAHGARILILLVLLPCCITVTEHL